MAMSTPSMEGQMSELEMDEVLQEYGLLEAGMTSIEKLELIQTLEASKISAQTEQDSRLKEEDDISILSTPFLRHQTPSMAGTSASCPSPGDEPSPLIGGPTLAQRRRPLHVLPSSDQAPKMTSRGRQSPQSVDDRHWSSLSADDHQHSSQSADNRPQSSQSADDHQQSSQSVKSRRQQFHASASCHQPIRSANGRDRTSHSVDNSGDGSPLIVPAARSRRLSAASGSSSECCASLAEDSPSPQLLAVEGAESTASSPRPIPHFVNNEGRSEAVERSERAVRLLKLLSDAATREENVRRVLQHMELEQQQTLTDVEHRSWPDDILPSRNFQESSIPSPLDAARLVYRLPKGAEQSRASASREPSPESPPPRLQPASSSGLQVADTGRHHCRANQLLQRAIGTHSTKKPSTTPKLLPKLSNRSGASAAPAVPDRDLATRPSTSAAAAAPPVLPLLPSPPAGAEPPLAGTSVGRRRRASAQAETTGPAKQARRRPPDAEIRPAPLRLPSERTEPPKRSMVPLVTKVQRLGEPSTRRSTPTGPLTTLSTSSSDEDPAPTVVSRTGATHRPVRSSAGGGTLSRAAASGDASGGTSAGAGAGGEAAAGAAGDAATGQLRIECPLCGVHFPQDKIETHASRCEGEGVVEIEESPSPPLRRSAVTAGRTARERTPGGQQRCRLCSELFEEGAAYLEHVDECLRHRRRSNGGEVAPAPESGRRPATDRDWPAGDGLRPSDRSDPADPTSGSGFPATFQPISVQTNSSIDYHNQFPVASGNRARRGRRRRGRGVGRTRGNGRRA